MKFIRFQLGIFLLTFAVTFASKYSCDADIHGSIYNASSFEPYSNANLLCIPHYAYKKLLDSDNLVPPFAQGYDDYMTLNTSEKKYLLEEHGIMTLLEHQLAFATRMHLEEWNSGIEEGSPDFLTFSPRIMRQMIMLALFHDTEYYSSASNHGEISGQYLVGILDEDLMKFLVHHTSLTHYFEFEFFKLPEAHPLEEVERTLPRRWQRWFDLADWDIDYQMTPKWPVNGEKYDFRKHYMPLEFFLQTYNIDVCEEEAFVWGAPSMWIERIPVLLANELKLWGTIRKPETGERYLFFDQVEVEVCNGGPELIQQFLEGKIHIGELGIFPFINHARTAGDNLNMKLIGSSFIAELEHYLVSGNPDIRSIEDLKGKRVGVLSHGSCDSYLLEYILKHQSPFQMLDVEVVPLQKAYGKSDVLIPTSQRADATKSLPYVDACFLVDPGLAKAMNENSNVTVLTRAGDLFSNFQWNALIASNELLKERVAGNMSKAHIMMEVYQKSVQLMHDALVKYYPNFEPLSSSFFQNQYDIYFDEVNIVDVSNALESIALEAFQVSVEILYSALARGFKDWRMQYADFDFEGAEVCTNLFFRQPTNSRQQSNDVDLRELFHVFKQDIIETPWAVY